MATKPRRCVLVCDSRGHPFIKLKALNADKYYTSYIIRRGARVYDLYLDTIKQLCRIKEDGHKGLVPVILCGGINELTELEKHSGGTELRINRNQNLKRSLQYFKEELRQLFPNTVITIASIPVVDFVAANEHYTKVGKLWHPKYTVEDLVSFQGELSTTLREINHWIFLENQKAQITVEIGTFTANQLYLHQYVEKLNSKTTVNGRKIMKRRIAPNALADGIHPTENLVNKWHTAIHENFMKTMHKIDKGTN
jgi:hypothetical protein